jgi:hypothetical protein
MAAMALSNVKVLHCVPLMPISAPTRMDDKSIQHLEVDAPIYNTNLICLPPSETVRLIGATHYSLFDKRYNIGFWQWELS